MAEWIRTMRGALTFDTAAFTRFHDRRDVFFRGFVLIVLVALITGLPGLVIDSVKGLRPTSVQAEMDEARSGFDRFLQQFEPVLQNAIPDAAARDIMIQQMRDGMDMGLRIGERIGNLPTVLPGPVNRLLTAVGGWFSRPFGGASFPLAAATLSTWLGYGIWVMLVAKLLGGRGDLAGFFGTTSLFAVPQLLNIFHRIPFLGGLLGFIAFLWGLAIYVKATAVSQKMSIERALLAVFVPILVVALIVVVLATGLIGLIAIAASGQ